MGLRIFPVRFIEVSHKGFDVQGMRAVIALAKEPSTEDQLEAAAANETWVAYPDDSPRRSPFFAGDSRAAMVPLLAHQASTLYEVVAVSFKHCSRDPISCLRKGCPLPS